MMLSGGSHRWHPKTIFQKKRALYSTFFTKIYSSLQDQISQIHATEFLLSAVWEPALRQGIQYQKKPPAWLSLDCVYGIIVLPNREHWMRMGLRKATKIGTEQIYTAFLPELEAREWGGKSTVCITRDTDITRAAAIQTLTIT